MVDNLRNVPQQLLIAGEWENGDRKITIYSPYDGTKVGETYLASPTQIERAVAGVVAAAPLMARLAVDQRVAILTKVMEGLREKRELLVELLALEAGKPVKEGMAEFERALLTVQTAAEEAKRIGGSVIPLDLLPTTRGRWGIVRRFPRGPVLAITPFNYPLNLVMHKLAPAVAAGCPVLLKPSPRTPLIGLAIARIFNAADMPTGALSVLLTDNDTTRALVRDDRFKVVTFTGSAEVGWQLQKMAGKKKVLLELGGNAGVIIEPDADLDWAAERVVFGGFVFAGQSCISVQRVYIHESIYQPLAEMIKSRVQALRIGDPRDPRTELGPLIDSQAVERTLNWIREAESQGARILLGGREKTATILEPTIMEQVPRDCNLYREEVFAPLIILESYRDFYQTLTAINNSRFGLQAGIFTKRQDYLWAAFERLEVGAVISNDVPTFRLDPMPYGGIKDSGIGREGPRYAIEELTEPRLLVINSQT